MVQRQRGENDAKSLKWIRNKQIDVDNFIYRTYVQMYLKQAMENVKKTWTNEKLCTQFGIDFATEWLISVRLSVPTYIHKPIVTIISYFLLVPFSVFSSFYFTRSKEVYVFIYLSFCIERYARNAWLCADKQIARKDKQFV